MLRTLLLAACLAVSACAPSQPPQFAASLVAAADPSRRVPTLLVGDASAGTRRFQVVGPRNWEDVNREIAPTPEGAKP